MLKITISRQPTPPGAVSDSRRAESRTVELEGKLAGPWVEELERSWRSEAEQVGAAAVTVSLRSIGYVDAKGKALLAQMVEAGTRVEGAGCMTCALIEDIGKTVRGWAGGAHGHGKKTVAVFILAAVSWGAALGLRAGDSGTEQVGTTYGEIQTEGARP